MNTAADSPSREQRIDQLIAEFIQAKDAGTPIDEAAFLASNPEFAESLKAFFDDRRRIDRVAARVPAINSDPTLADLRAAGSTSIPQPGTRLRYFGDYELIDEIARGGMGIVFKARQVSLNRVVALKMILAGNFASEADVRRFHAEAESAANLDHPNIVPIHEVGEHEGLHYFSMKLIEGGSLSRSIPRFTADPKAAAALLATIARAVHHAHQRGILHRDLKPSNILLDKDGQPRVTDFGLAKQVDGGESRLTISGAILGTPSYMPPEQAAGEKSLTTAADVYSLGAILYELITARPPFAAATPLETLRKVLVEAPLRPTSPAGKIDRDLETIILKCLEKDPQRRYASASDLADELDRFIAGKPIEARPVGAAQRAWRWCRRNPLVATLILLIGVSLFAGSIISSHFAIKATARAKDADDNAAIARAQEKRADAARVQADQNAADEAKARAAAESSLYISKISQIQNEFSAQNIGRAEELLDECPEKFRAWEWHYLKRLRYGAYQKLEGHSASVWGVSFSNDSKRLVTASWDFSARVWDVYSGSEKLRLKHSGNVWNARFSPDGKFIATASNSGVKIWDAISGIELRTLPHAYPSAVMNLAYNNDGTQLASSGYDGTVRLWDFTTEKETIFTGHTGGVRGLAFRPDGKQIVSAGDDATVRIWDVKTGQQAFPTLNTKAPSWGAAYSPDGLLIAAASAEGTVQLWHADTAKEAGQIITDTNFDVSFSNDSRRLVTCSWTKLVKLWDVATCREVLTLRGHDDTIHRVIFSPDGLRIASVGFDNHISVWNASPLAQSDRPDSVTLAVQDHAIECVGWSASGTQIGWSYKNSVRLWDPATLAPGARRESYTVGSFPTGLRTFAFSPDGHQLAGVARGDKSIRIFDTESGKLIQTLEGHTDNVTCVAFSPDGQRLLSGGDGGERAVRLWDLKTKQQSQLGFHQNSVSGVAFDALDPQRTVSVGGDNTLMARKGNSSEGRFNKPHAKWISAVAFSRDGKRLVTASHDATAVIWDAATLNPIHTLTGHTDRVMHAAFSPDVTRVATASGDGTIRLWDAATGKPLHTLRGHSGYVHSLTFNPDGKQLISAGGNRTRGEVILWYLDRLKM